MFWIFEFYQRFGKGVNRRKTHRRHRRRISAANDQKLHFYSVSSEFWTFGIMWRPQTIVDSFKNIECYELKLGERNYHMLTKQSWKFQLPILAGFKDTVILVVSAWVSIFRNDISRLTKNIAQINDAARCAAIVTSVLMDLECEVGTYKCLSQPMHSGMPQKKSDLMR